MNRYLVFSPDGYLLIDVSQTPEISREEMEEMVAIMFPKEDVKTISVKPLSPKEGTDRDILIRGDIEKQHYLQDGVLIEGSNSARSDWVFQKYPETRDTNKAEDIIL